MAAPTPALEMTGIRKSFVGVPALSGVDLKLMKGEALGLVGENGAGKSTMMKVLSGAHAKDEGSIRIAGVPADIRGPADARDLGISIIYQELSLFPDLDAVENIFMGRQPTRWAAGRIVALLDRRSMEAEARRIFDEQLGASVPLDVPVGRLKLAERQLIEIARALSANAEIIVMDEPTEALEIHERERLVSVIDNLKAIGKSIIYVSHRIDELLRICNRVMVLRDGASVADLQAREVDAAKVIGLMIGGSLSKQFLTRVAVPSDEVVLSVEKLSRAGDFEDVSFRLRRREILGIAGLAGSGKSALVRSLFGALQHDAGTISINGAALDVQSVADGVKAGLAFLPAERKVEGVFPEHDVAWNMTIAGLDRLAKGRIRRSVERGCAERYMRELGVKASGPWQAMGGLSGGNQQKVLLARWLLRDPEVLILEEPTRGVDVRAKADVYKLIAAAVDGGKAAIVVSADGAELLGLCDRILVLFEGHVAKELVAADTSEETITYYSVEKR